jgi:uncharacterized membrane protein (DUF485 family)
MLKRIFLKITAVVTVIVGFVFLIPTIMLTTIYFLVKPDKLKEFNQEIKVEKTESNNTGIH